MRRLWYLGAAAVLLTALGFHGPPTDAAGKNFFYVHDDGAPNEVHGFMLASDGTVTELPGSPFDTGADSTGCGGMCQTLTYAKKGRFLFASSDNGIAVFTVAKDGALTLVPGSPFGGVRILGLATVKKKNKTFVYGSEFNADQVRGFLVNANGSLSELPGSPFPAGVGPDGMSSTANGLFVANEDGDSISAYRINNDGSLTQPAGSPFSTGAGFHYNVNATPDGRFVYTADAGDSEVVGFVVNPVTAALTPLPGSPFAADISTEGGLAVGTGDVLIALDRNVGDPDLQAFRYPKTNGLLTALGGGQEAGTSSQLDGGAIDPKQRHLVVSAGANDLLRVFDINRVTGQLTEVETQNVVLGNVTGIVFAK